MRNVKSISNEGFDWKSITQNEDQIDLIRYPVVAGSAKTSILLTTDYLKINATPVDGNIAVERIGPDAISAFMTLYQNAIGLRQNQPNYITAVKLKYGISADLSKIVLIYQPILLIKYKDTDQQQKIREYDTIEGSNFVFSAAEEDFIPAPAEYISWITNYENTIKIRKFTSNTLFTDFSKGHDIDAVIFSFQEIFSLIDHNLPNNTVLIYNSIFVDHDPSLEIKHTIMFSPNIEVSPLEKIYSGIFYQKFANLAHLCPPNCPKMKFNLV